ncbi:MAG: GH32 C-terminal domain-containing protein, partial [Chloroflexota bacterium]|nr:GH32 C-terminal domain-containing protein [Chloroflexota bacterium]
AGDCLEVRATFAPAGDAVVGLALRRTPDGTEETRVRYDRARGLLTLDCARSSLDVGVDREVDGAALPLAPDEPLELRVFLDRSVVEVFANGRVAVSDRIYPSRPDALGVGAFVDGSEARLASLDVWGMAPIWPTTE